MLNLALCLGLLARVPLLEALLEPREVTVPSAGVGDDVVRVLGVLGDDGIVNYAAALVEEDGEGRRVGREGVEGGWGEPFEERGRGRAAEAARG